MTRALTLALTLVCASEAVAGGLPQFAHERVKTFATCSGRLSALATRQSALDDPEAAATREMRQVFEMLLEATLDDAYAEGMPESQTERWRASGWSEMARLMNETRLGDTGRAEAVLAERVGQCRGLVLPG